MKSNISRFFAPILVICGIVIGAILTYLVLFSWKSVIKSMPQQAARMTEEQTKPEKLADIPQTATTTAVHEESILNTPIIFSNAIKRLYSKALDRNSIPKQSNQVDVEWNEAKEVPQSEWVRLLGGVLSADKIDSMLPSTVSRSDQENERMWIRKIWRVGSVAEGSYSGGGVYVFEFDGNFPFPGVNALEIVRSEDGLRIAAVQRSESQEDPRTSARELGLPVEDNVFRLYGGEFFDTLTVKGKKFVLSSVYSLGAIYDETNHMVDPSRIRYVVTSEEGVELYQDSISEEESKSLFMGEGCLFALMADGTWMRYSIFLPAYTNNLLKSAQIGEIKRMQDPGIQWAAGYENTNEYYGVSMSGCGFGVCSDITNLTAEEEKDLVQVGTEKDTKDPIYAFQHPEESRTIQALYDMWYSPSQSATGKKSPLHEMVSTFKVPVFFWKDPIGRWNRYTVSDLQPMAECGKPVIYLYPETKTDVRVALPSFISVTKSDPIYPKKGWNVTANPNGDLVSRADGKTYGSLYWEGTGVGYQPPTTGFVIDARSVTSTLSTLLAKYGLSQKESFEFMEFWLPKFSETKAPYFRVSFLTNEWSKAAPLNVLPRPKTSIRIFMDWQPLSAPISIAEPKIVTPVRDGFTLVEWGGLLHK